MNYAILTPFYTRILGLSEYGIVSELYAYMAVLLVLLTYGMETAFFRFASNDKNPEKVFHATVTSIGFTSVIFLGLILLFLEPVSQFMEYETHKEYILFFTGIVALDAFTAIPFAKLRLENKGLKFGLIKLANVTVIIAIVFVFLYLLPEIGQKSGNNGIIKKINDADIGVGYVFIANLFGSLISLLLLMGEFKGYKPVINWRLWKSMFNYALPLLIAGLFGILNESFDKIVLKRLVVAKNQGLAILGEYSANYKIAVLMTLFIQMFRYAVEPFFFKEAKKKNPEILYAKVMLYFILFALVVYIGIIINLKIVILLIGKNYRGGVGIVPVVLAANVLYGIFINLSVWYKINDKTWYATLINGTGVIITLIINITLIPVFSYYASAWGHVLAYIVMVLTSYFIGKRIYPIPYNIKRIMLYLIGFGVFYLIIRHYDYLNNFIYLITFNGLLLISIFAIYKLEKKKI